MSGNDEPGAGQADQIPILLFDPDPAGAARLALAVDDERFRHGSDRSGAAAQAAPGW